MIKYCCEVSLSLDRCCVELDRLGARYNVTHERELSFRERPTRRVKEILSRHGFKRDETISWPSDEQIEALKNRFKVREAHRG